MFSYIICIITGYYAFGAQVTLVAICPPSKDGDKHPVVVDIVKSDLRQVKDRVCHLRRMMNISRLLETIKELVGIRNAPEFIPITR